LKAIQNPDVDEYFCNRVFLAQRNNHEMVKSLLKRSSHKPHRAWTLKNQQNLVL